MSEHHLYGTLAWAEAAEGQLSAGEQVRETAKALRTVAAATPGTVEVSCVGRLPTRPASS